MRQKRKRVGRKWWSWRRWCGRPFMVLGSGEVLPRESHHRQHLLREVIVQRESRLRPLTRLHHHSFRWLLFFVLPSSLISILLYLWWCRPCWKPGQYHTPSNLLKDSKRENPREFCFGMIWNYMLKVGLWEGAIKSSFSGREVPLMGLVFLICILCFVLLDAMGEWFQPSTHINGRCPQWMVPVLRLTLGKALLPFCSELWHEIRSWLETKLVKWSENIIWLQNLAVSRITGTPIPV